MSTSVTAVYIDPPPFLALDIRSVIPLEGKPKMCRHERVTIGEPDAGWVAVSCDDCPYAFSVIPTVLP